MILLASEKDPTQPSLSAVTCLLAGRFNQVNDTRLATPGELAKWNRRSQQAECSHVLCLLSARKAHQAASVADAKLNFVRGKSEVKRTQHILLFYVLIVVKMISPLLVISL